MKLKNDLLPTDLTDVGGTLYFAEASSLGLWKSDGTAKGTQLVHLQNSIPFDLTNVDGVCYFATSNENDGVQLWRSNGSDLGTTMVKQITPPGASVGLKNMTAVNGVLYFAAFSGTTWSLWRSDLSGAGTIKLHDFFDVMSISSVDAQPFFSAADVTDNYELWTSDGSPAGTKLVHEINPAGGSHPFDLTNFNGQLYFFASDGTHGPELWTYDVNNGTRMVYDLHPGKTTGYPGGLIVVNNSLYFLEYNGTNTFLWQSGGVGTPAVPIQNVGIVVSLYVMVANEDGRTFYFSDYNSTNYDNWSSDGTTAGTILERIVGHELFGGATLNNTFFFAARDKKHGVEIWTITEPFAVLDNGTLRINGTTGPDVLGIRVRNSILQVRLNGELLTYDLGQVSQLSIDTGDGDDVVDWSGTAIPGYINAGTGRDLVTGGSGNDTLTGAASSDTLFGGPGDDRINGNNNADSLFGQSGNDTIHGGMGDDTIDGGTGVDRIFGDEDNDSLVGGAGNDKLHGDGGIDQIIGGAGTDLAYRDTLDTLVDAEVLVSDQP